MSKTSNVNRFLTMVWVMVLLGTCLFPIASIADENKIPITTSSDQARQTYLKGRDLADRPGYDLELPLDEFKNFMILESEQTDLPFTSRCRIN